MKKPSLSIKSPTIHKAGRKTGTRLFKNLSGHIISAICEGGGSLNAWQITQSIRKHDLPANDVTVRRYINDLVRSGHLKTKKAGRAVNYSISELDGKSSARAM